MSESEPTLGVASAKDAIAREHTAYWRANIRLVFCLLVVWFAISCVCGIFFVEPLNEIHFAGFKLGFWIAQQGSIIVFILLILTYCLAMEKIDKRHHVEEKDVD